MVQRKAPNKLGIQADRPKPEKRPGSLKPSSQQQDGRNRGGPELKKKMKKSSRPMKVSDFGSRRSSLSPPSRQEQPGKPPPQPPGDDSFGGSIQQKQYVPTNGTATPQKQSPIKTSDGGSPNYMKPTSSSDARKERSPVSNRNTSTSSGSKTLNRRNSNNAKPARTLTRTTSSLKRVRTLTKAPTFKPPRASAKKCSQVALCATDIDNVQRATCSSTLKESKFPSYLILNPEGTSVMKVCPYTYCSLNGHHHGPLPPLKCFVSARRRLLKTQRSLKLGPLSPRRERAIGEEDTIEVDTLRQMMLDEKPVFKEEDLSSPAEPLIQEDMDLFIEIYAKEKEGTAGNIDDTGDEEMIDFEGELEDLEYVGTLVEDGNESATEKGGRQTHESVSSGPSHWEIDPEDAIDQNLNLAFTNREITEESPGKDQKVEAADGGFPPSLAREERVPQCIITNGCECISEATDMDWEEEQFYGNVDSEADTSIHYHDETELESGYPSEIENPDLNDSYENIPIEILEQCFEEEMDETAKIDGFIDIMITSSEKPVEVADKGESDGVSEAKSEIHHREPQLSSDASKFKDVLHEAYAEDQYSNKSLQDDGVNAMLGSGLSSTQQYTKENNSESNKYTEIHQLDAVGDGSEVSQHFADESLLAEIPDDLSDKNAESCNITKHQNSLDRDQNEANLEGSRKTKSSLINCSSEDVKSMEMEDDIKSDAESNMTNKGMTKTSFNAISNSDRELFDTCNKLKVRNMCKRPITEEEELRKFNPREPNFLPVEADPEAERVDLRHQMTDERKNSEEWMLDYALRQAVAKLGPARKRKVALLVEAFETVMPVSNCEAHPTAFAHPRPIQACS